MRGNSYLHMPLSVVAYAALTVLVVCSVGRSQVAESVRYAVTFDADWSQDTHPDGFPGNPHFSGLIGGTHNGSVHFWQPGGLASPGIEIMAETGRKDVLDEEVRMAIEQGTAESVISGGGISVSPGSVAAEFSITRDFSFVSLVSMIAPSPDWFVGVHDLNLYPDDEWVGRISVDLWPYDAGTDSGPVYVSTDVDTEPAGPIDRLTTGAFEGTPPLGRFTFLRVLDGDYNATGTLDAFDIDELTAAVRDGSADARYDLDGSGSVDSDDRRFWVQTLRQTSFGDANLDGHFSSADLIDVTQTGQYEDSVAGNATWATGDWTGDGEFDTADLILALEAGTYEGVVPTAASAVPEPSSLCLLTIAVLVMHRRLGRPQPPGIWV